jgi:hypothetical protein
MKSRAGSWIREPEGQLAAEPAVRIDEQSEKQAPPHPAHSRSSAED